MSSRQNSTLSTSSIIVKMLEKRNLAGKKMSLPNDLKAFRRQIELLFGLKQAVQALYTENGDLITDINQIFPSTTIIASTVPLNLNSSFSSQRQNMKDSMRTSKDINNNTNSNIYDNDQSYDSDEELLPSSSQINKNSSFNNTNNANNSENYDQYLNSSSFSKQYKCKYEYECKYKFKCKFKSNKKKICIKVSK